MGIQFNDYERRIMNPNNPLEAAHRQDASFAAMSRRWAAREAELAQDSIFNGLPNRAGLVPEAPVTTPVAPTPVPVAPVTTPLTTTRQAVQTATSTVSQVIKNPTTGKYDVISDGKVIKSFYNKDLAEKYSTKYLKGLAPLGKAPQQVPQTKQTAQVFPTKDGNEYAKMLGENSKAQKPVSKLGKAPARPAKPPVTFDSYAREHGIDLRTGKKVAQNADNAITANHAYKNALEKHLAKPTDYSAEAINRRLGIKPEPTPLEHAQKQKMYENLFGKVDDVQDNAQKIIKNKNISDKVNILTNKVDDIGNNIGKLTGKVDGLTGKVGGMSDKLDDIANLVKSNNKKVALVAGAAALVGGLVGGLIAWAATKNKKAEEAENVEPTPVTPTPVPENEEENVTPVTPTPEVEETEPALPLDKDGVYTTKEGDCFWNIAKRHLEDKYKDDPEKFANKTQKEKDAMIQLETRRIMKLNGYSLAEDKWYSAPTLHPNVKIQITEKVDLAA